MKPEALARRNAGPPSRLGELPLFPLRTWLYPGIPLRLQIFEPRYLDMITSQLKGEQGFGIVPIRHGSEVGSAPVIHPFGVEVTVRDWNQLPNGTLGITVSGERKFRVRRSRVQTDNLMRAEIEYLPSEPAVAVDDQFQGLLDLLNQLKQHPAIRGLQLPAAATTVALGCQLAYLLPLTTADKTTMLTLADPAERLTLLARRIGEWSQV